MTGDHEPAATTADPIVCLSSDIALPSNVVRQMIGVNGARAWPWLATPSPRFTFSYQLRLITR